jgi:non-ribosomal peptide synthase protein (TIGR01720 family)
LIEAAWNHLLTRHDALRVRFERTEDSWRQEVTGTGLSTPFYSGDLSGLDGQQRQQAMKEIASRAASSVDISRAPLLRVDHLALGPEHSGCFLLITMHDLITDDRSWRILVDEMHMAYEQLERGKEVQLPPMTDSYSKWSAHLSELAESESLADEIDFWTSQTGEVNRSLVPDRESHPGAGFKHSSVSLNDEETAALLEEVPISYRADIREVLLAALARALSTTYAATEMLIDLETDWRSLEDGISLSRTVGHLTDVFPASLDIRGASEAAGAIKSVKEQMRRVPNRGLYYGVLRYLNTNRPGYDRLLRMPQPDWRFRYRALGESDPTSGSLITRVVDLTEAPRTDSYSMIVTAVIESRKLRVEWSYRENVHAESKVDALCRIFIESLRSLIAGSQSPDSGTFIPSDFPLAKLDEHKLNRLSLLLEMADEPGLEVSE